MGKRIDIACYRIQYGCNAYKVHYAYYHQSENRLVFEVCKNRCEYLVEEPSDRCKIPAKRLQYGKNTLFKKSCNGLCQFFQESHHSQSVLNYFVQRNYPFGEVFQKVRHTFVRPSLLENLLPPNSAGADISFIQRFYPHCVNYSSSSPFLFFMYITKSAPAIRTIEIPPAVKSTVPIPPVAGSLSS